MSKLFKLKEWLTVVDAARHLSIVFGEEVTEADVLRFALDGRLRLSVNFVNRAECRTGRIVPIGEAHYKELPDISGNGTVRIYGGPVLTTGEVQTHVLELEKDIAELHGLYDLPMIGSEKLDVEHRYQILTGGPAITLQGYDGALVEGMNGLLCQLQYRYKERERRELFNAEREKVHEYVAKNNIKFDEAAKMMTEVVDDKRHKPTYYPRDSLPEDSVIVVRTAALADFEQSVNGTSEVMEKPLSTKERDTLLKLVIGMAMKGYCHSPSAAKNNAPKEISDDLAALGISVSDDTVRKYLKQAADTVLPSKPHQS